MNKQLIFFQGGGGEEDHNTDAKMLASLQSKLPSAYSFQYPLLLNEKSPDFGRAKQIAKAIAQSDDGVILVAHSLGASMLIKYLSENKVSKKIAGIFLISTPFWNKDEDWVQPLKLKNDFAEKLDHNIPLFFYQTHDDKEVPFAQLAMYQQQIPWASFIEIAVGGHNLSNDLTLVAEDIKSL